MDLTDKNPPRRYYGYFGYMKTKGNGSKVKMRMVYVGTTIQEPEARFRWHKANGKPNVRFEVVKEFDNAKDMLGWEHNEIKCRRPLLNTRRTLQNLNVPLGVEELESRVGNPKWCQCCKKRRVNEGYTRCYFCENEHKYRKKETE